MEPEAKYTLVGTVVMVLLALIAGAVVWLKSTGGQRDDMPYKIYFARQSLEGLQIRSDVKMKGIKVGSVTSFRISARRPGTVEVMIRVDESAPVLQSTRAEVERHLLTGIASIRLVNADEGSPPLKQVQPDEQYPLIAEGESEYKIAESVANLAARADETLKRINRTLTDENLAALADILASLRRISANVDRSLAGLDKTVASMGRAAEQVAGDTRRLADRYDKLGAESTVAVREVSASVRRVSEDVARLSARADALFADGSVELRATAQELRAAADSLGATARRLGDPGKVIFGPPPGSLGPGEAQR